MFHGQSFTGDHFKSASADDKKPVKTRFNLFSQKIGIIYGSKVLLKTRATAFPQCA